ncbi:MAG: lamin tail domain-containing protein [Candidatus Cloacimonetes bacterium]|nr:lamin tail domain-containing protein [Candidatus Cloacimonadota bacterium]
MINELYYDHPGNDTGYEWIEFYNMSNTIIDLTGWRVESGGSEFTEMFEFPAIIIGAHDYLVVGDFAVSEADWVTSLSFQNGGTATDGVRIISPDSIWTDTVLYDEPNSNELPDDLGVPGSSFAPDVTAGKSIGRYPDGLDTNSGSDWRERKLLTPGRKNWGEIDLTIVSARINEIENECLLDVRISNLSTENVDNFAGNLDIYLNGLPLESWQIPPCGGLATIDYELILSGLETGYQLTRLVVNSIYDYNLANNNRGASILLGQSPLILNELMIKPQSDYSEWVEVILRGKVDNFVDNLLISDENGDGNAFQVADQSAGYYVLGGAELSGEYGIFPENIIITAGFPGLNNDGDIVTIKDIWGTLLDSLSYGNLANEAAGVSYERINPEAADSDWGNCEAAAGHTAAAVNSIMCGEIDMSLQVTGVRYEEGNINHNFNTHNCGMYNVEEGILHISWLDFWGLGAGEFEAYLAFEEEMQTVTTNVPGEGYYFYEYFLEIDEDANPADNLDYWYLNTGSLAWVINEIMYHPASGEPEWLEVKRNLPETAAVELGVTVDVDSCEFAGGSEYIIITGDEADREHLLAKYGMELEIYCGLGRLVDDGGELSIADEYGNEFERFCYESSWNDERQGISIERVNPLIPAEESNWSRSVTICTPGRENSIHTEIEPSEAKLSIQPDIFSPAAGESAVIIYQNPENLNKVKVRIYDLKGRLVRLLVDQDSQGMEGYYIWDGRDAQGKIAGIGVYIVLFESTDGERNFREKATVTIAW